MKKPIIAAIIVVVVLGAFYLLNSDETKAPITQDTGTPENIVTNTNSGYEPSTLTVKTGSTVTFKNMSTHSMWTASGPHPSHTSYPEPGGCLGSTFDTCRGVMPGESWSFTFNKVGTWGYHDHLNPGFRGTIIVE